MASASRPSALAVALQASIDGDLCLLKKMADKVNLQEAKDDFGQGVLHFAAGKGHLELCRFLVEELGLDVNSITADSGSPVHRAALFGNESVLRYLLSCGGDPRMLDSEGTSLLHFAVMGGAFLQAAADGDLGLLKEMADKVNLHEAKDASGNGVLHLATENGHLELCKFLVEELGLDVNSVNAEGESPVHLAAQENEGVLRYLLSRGGDPGMVDLQGTSLLHFAAMGGNCDAVNLLLSMGVDVDPPNFRGTPLHVAAINDQVQVVKILLEHGADPNKVVGHVYSPLMMACIGHSLESMKLLVKAGADVNFCPPSGRSILAKAIDRGFIDIVKFLLEAGADPNLVDKDGEIPIMYAAVNGQRELVEILFPKTRPVPSVPDWSVDGIIGSARDLLFYAHDAAVVEERIADKSQGKEAFAKGEYFRAVYFYSLAMEKDSSDATLVANRSLCWLRLREGDKAMSDAFSCILMRPHWSKAWYRQGAAFSLIKYYEGAVLAFDQALKLDPASDEIKKALREAIAGMEGAA